MVEEVEGPEFGEAKYLRLIGGKVHCITAAEAITEEVLTRPRILTDQDMIVLEWNDRVKVAERLKEQISLTHEMMREDERRPSRYQAGYSALWDEYSEAIKDLREIDSEWVRQFRDKVVAMVEELTVQINAMLGNWDPEGFGDFEQVLARYEGNYDLMMALQKVV